MVLLHDNYCVYLFVKARYVQSLAYSFFIEYVVEKGFIVEKVLLPFDFQFSLITEDERLTVILKKVDCVLTSGESQKNRSQELSLGFLQKRTKMMKNHIERRKVFVGDLCLLLRFDFVHHVLFIFFSMDASSSSSLPYVDHVRKVALEILDEVVEAGAGPVKAPNKQSSLLR